MDDGTLRSEDSASRPNGVAPKITDFGLAKRIDDAVRDVSKSGATMGTASYMAPEQAAGKVHDKGPAADVYALGSLLYECLTASDLPEYSSDSQASKPQQMPAQPGVEASGRIRNERRRSPLGRREERSGCSGCEKQLQSVRTTR